MSRVPPVIGKLTSSGDPAAPQGACDRPKPWPSSWATRSRACVGRLNQLSWTPVDVRVCGPVAVPDDGMYENPPYAVKLKPAGGAITPYQCASGSVGSAIRARSSSESTCVQNVASPPLGAVPKLAAVTNGVPTWALIRPIG